MPGLGEYSREIVLARPDMRTREGRLFKRRRAELARHLGGVLTAPQRALVDRAALGQLRCAMLDTAKPAWVEPLSEGLADLTGKIAAADVWQIVGKPAYHRTQADNVGVGEAMRALDWARTMQRIDGEPVSAYVRGMAAERRVPIFAFNDPATGNILIYRTTLERLFESEPVRVLRRERKRPFSEQ